MVTAPITGKMDKYKWYRTVQEYLFQIIIMLAAVIGMVIAHYAGDEKISSLVSGVSASLFASALVAIGSLVLFRNISKRKEVCDQWGLDAIYELRQEANTATNAYQEAANERIDAIAFGLGSWRNARRDVILKLLRKGIKIRIITPHPDNPFLPDIDRSEGKLEGSTRTSIVKLALFVNKNSKGNDIRIKFYMNRPLDSYFRVDNHIFVGPYLYGRASQQTITYEFGKGGNGFTYYSTFFENIWNEVGEQKLDFKEFSPLSDHSSN